MSITSFLLTFAISVLASVAAAVVIRRYDRMREADEAAVEQRLREMQYEEEYTREELRLTRSATALIGGFAGALLLASIFVFATELNLSMTAGFAAGAFLALLVGLIALRIPQSFLHSRALLREFERRGRG